jgi:hypothetical protein
MNYLFFICTDDVPDPEQGEVMRREVTPWVDEMDSRGVRLLGRPLVEREKAVTVRVRDGETLVTDGPYSESKEWVAGFDLIDCADLDEAIEIAAKHPVSWFNQIEIRPFWDGLEFDDEARAYAASDGSGDPVYLMLMFVDGVPEAPEVEGAILRDGLAWAANLKAQGKQILGHPLEHKDTATTVRVRNGETLISDGPFVETHEFIGGLDLVRCASWKEAVEIAAAHPLAKVHAVEVREVWNL